MTDPPEPRHSLTAITRFCADLTEGVAGYVGCAHKRQESDGAHPRSFRWVRPAWLDSEVKAFDWWVCHDAADPYYRRSGQRSPPYPVETMVRLQACAEVPLDSTEGKVRGGKITDLCTVMGLSVDIDVGERRAPDDQCDHETGLPYCPMFGPAMDLVADLAPTYSIDAGGGLIPQWWFAFPHTDVSAATDLALDIKQLIAERCAEHGHGFNSPHPLVAWCKVPGTWSAKYQRVVEVIDRRDRWDFDALRAVIPVYEHHTWHGYVDMTTWNGQEIPGLTDPGPGGTRGQRINHARDRARALWHHQYEEQR